MAIKTTREMQREAHVAKQDKEKTLERLFEQKDAAGRTGSAFVWVGRKGKDGQTYGSSKYVHRDCLVGREYTLSQSSLGPWEIHILFTDEIFEYGKKMLPLSIPKKAIVE